MNQQMTTLWRVHIRPESNDIDPVDVCVSKGIIGIGWRIDNKPKTKEEYEKEGEKKYGNTSWRKAKNAILYRMKPGDLVWIRDLNGIYYIGKIISDWEYRDEEENLKSDIINVRSCKLFKVGASIAGKIVNSFVPSATVQIMNDGTANLFSRIIDNKLSGANEYDIKPKNDELNFFNLITDEDLEDIAGLYLQYEKNYLIVPSSRTRRNDTIFYEYQLINRKDGEMAFIQVKSGNVRLTIDKYANFENTIYLFSPAGYNGDALKYKHIKIIDNKSVINFINRNMLIMPPKIKVWIDYIEEINSSAKANEKNQPTSIVSV